MEFSIVILFVSLLLFSSTCSGDSNNTYHVNSSFALEQYMCNTTWSSQYLVFLLNSSVNFTISPGNFCQVSRQAIRVEIRSDSPTQSAIISCFHDNIPELPRRGLVFFNTSVTLERLIFNNCGTYLTTIKDNTIIEYLNSSSLYYTSSHAAALIFVHCQVNITQVNIYYSYGFAMIGVNLYDSSISRVIACNSSVSSLVFSKTSQVIGSGALLHYIDPPLQYYLQGHVYINISYVKFSSNYNVISGKQCITALYRHDPSSSDTFTHPIVNAAGLTLLYTQKTYSAYVHTNSTFFYNNIGGFGTSGGLLVLHYNSSVYTATIVNNSHFISNVNIGSPHLYCHGTALIFFWFGNSMHFDFSIMYSLIISGTKFVSNSGIRYANFGAGPIFIGTVNSVAIKVLFKKCIFQSNAAFQEGASMYAIAFKETTTSGSISIVLEDIVAINNFQSIKRLKLPLFNSGIFSFYGIHSVNITGTSLFHNNHGSVIEAVDTNIYLSGNITFNGNSGLRGAAIRLQSDSHLFFLKGITAMFTNNHAQLEGGAIYVGSSKVSTTLQNSCVFVFESLTSNIQFYGNTAINAGSSIYIESMFDCFINQSSEYISSVEEVIKYYKRHFKFVPNSSNHLYSLSSQPSSLVICDADNNHTDSLVLYRAYPGQRILLYVAAVDSLNQNVYSKLAIDLTTSKHLWLSYEYKEQVLNEGVNCTPITIAVHTKNDKDTSFDNKLVFSLPGFSLVRKIEIEIKPCPIGFVLNDKTGNCACSSVFYNKFLIEGEIEESHISCDIDTLTIARSKAANIWAGNISFADKYSFGISPLCPLDYSNSVESQSFCSSDSGISLVSPITGNCNNSVPLCLHQRVGPLCGSCGELSVVFGSSKCRECNNRWLWTLILYAVAGPLLIYLLYVLRLTLTTGTLNGIIFFAQAANCGMFDLLSHCNVNYQTILVWLANLSYTFISLLNLNLGFPLCFYNGMTELWKAGLSLVFPLYLLAIVAVVILLSHSSVRLSNKIADFSVQVLVTIVHLSFTKLLLAVINVFTPAKIYTANTTYNVWYWDGSVAYGVGSHRILMIITLLVVIPLLLPYVLLLIFTRPIRRTKINKYVRPLLEAIHAPYKEGKEYWFVARLFLLVFMLVVYSYYRAQFYLKLYVVSTPVFVMFLVLQTYHKPFKSKLVNIMDCLLMYNLAFLYSTTWMFIAKDERINATIIAVVTISLVFLILLIVLAYHILCVTGKISVFKRTLDTKYCQYKWKVLSLYSCSKSDGNCQLSNADDSFYGSCEYREPLLISHR